MDDNTTPDVDWDFVRAVNAAQADPSADLSWNDDLPVDPGVPEVPGAVVATGITAPVKP